MKPHSSTEHAETTEAAQEPPHRRGPHRLSDGAPTATAPWPVPAGEDAQWDDWRWQMRRRITSLAQLAASFPFLDVPPGLIEAAAKFPFAITPYYASLIRATDPSDPIFQMALPQAQELWDPAFLRDDPLEEEKDSPVPGLLHRYEDRALLIATSACAMYCRHCTRKRVTGARETAISDAKLRQVVGYLVRHPEIKDVIVSGGDPLTLATSALERIVRAIREVPSVEVIRVGTRAPVVLPMRITDELVRMLSKYHPLWVNTHFNHPRELTPEAAAACARLADAGIPLGNQSVLLRGINDNPRVMEQLLRGLVRMRVRPYYLYQCDLVRGVEHFRTPLTRGIEIMEYLRGRVSGFAIPQFVVDAPHGGGKIPLLPNYIVSQSPTHTVLRNFEGMMISYPEPGAQGDPAEPGDADAAPAGVWELARGKASAITPATTERLRRRTQRRASRAAEAKSAAEGTEAPARDLADPAGVRGAPAGARRGRDGGEGA